MESDCGTTAAPAALRSLPGLQQKSFNRIIWTSALVECLGLPDFKLNITEIRGNHFSSDGLLSSEAEFQKTET